MVDHILEAVKLEGLAAIESLYGDIETYLECQWGMSPGVARRVASSIYEAFYA